MILNARELNIFLVIDYHDKVFIIFQRLQSNADYPGIGIGLSICKKNCRKAWRPNPV